jgi:molecular chaperone GrpE
MSDKEDKKPESKGATPRRGSGQEKEASKTDRLKKERDEYLDGWKRAKADLINYKRDELKRLEQVVHFASEDMMRDVITVLDSFDLALASMEEGNPSKKGIYLIKSKLEDILKKKGLEKIEVEEGDKFDPEFHEAVDVVEEKSKEQDTVAEELEIGYTLHGKVIRAAKVKVYK